MINKIKEVYMCNIKVKDTLIWFEIHNDIDYNVIEIKIHYEDSWYQEYDKLFWTYKWYKEYTELKELIRNFIIDNSSLDNDNLEYNIHYND